MNKNWHTEEETGIVRGQMDKYDILGKSRHISLAVNFSFPKLVTFLKKASRALRMIQQRFLHFHTQVF